MKHSLIFALLSAIVLCTGCSRPSSLEESISTITHYPVMIDDQKGWSLITPDGQIAGENSFKVAPSVVMNGHFVAYDSTGVTLYAMAADGGFSPVEGAANLRYAGAVSEGRIPICRHDSAVEIIDTDGNRIFSLADCGGHNFNACGAMYGDGLLTVRDTESNLWGAVDRDGELVIEPAYAYLSMFNDGHALAINAKDRTLEVLDTKGNAVTAGAAGSTIECGNFIYRHALINDPTAGRRVIDTKGQAVELDAAIVPLVLCSKGVVFMNHMGLYGVAGWDGEVLMVPEKDRLIMPVSGTGNYLTLDPKLAPVSVIDAEGKVVNTFPKGYKEATPLFDGKGFVASGERGDMALLSPDLTRVGNIVIKSFNRRLSIFDIILSDRDADHRLLNSADPGDDLPEWMEPDKEDEDSTATASK